MTDTPAPLPGILPIDANQPLTLTGAIRYIPKITSARPVSELVYVMYEHWYNNQLIYIGLTELENLFTCPDARENPYWQEVVKENEQILVRPVMIGKHHTVLNEYLRRLSLQEKPYCNTYIKPWKGHRNVAIICSDGRIFKSQAEAALALGVPQSRVSNHVSNKSGYKTIKGLTLRPYKT